MKTIGLIGGMSWESTAEYYRIMNEAVKEKLGGLHSVKCILYSVDFEEIAALQHRGEYLILFNAIKELREQTHYKSPQIYFKIGTTGLGGMGLNLPYAHEQYTSEFMMRKAALSGAQTALLLLMGRSPHAPIIKEVKPAAAVFRNSVEYDQKKKMVFIDGGESGPYSCEEFSLITSLGQMGFITAEEVAEKIILKIKGDPTGHDVVSSLNRALIKPSYKAGVLKDNQRVLREIAALNLSISLPKHVNYSVGLKPFEPGEGNQISIDPKALDVRLEENRGEGS